MLWKNLRRLIATYCDKHPEHAGVRLIQEKADAKAETIARWLEFHYEIRNIAALRLVLPEAFPKPLKHGSLLVDKNIHGAWRVTAHKPAEQDSVQ